MNTGKEDEQQQEHPRYPVPDFDTWRRIARIVAEKLDELNVHHGLTLSVSPALLERMINEITATHYLAFKDSAGRG